MRLMQRSLSRRRSTGAWLVLVLLLGALAGCRGATPIKTLLDDPGRYDGQTVRVAGDVTSAVGVLGYGAYRLNDGTASILVVTPSGGAPREGARVGVEGTFKQAFTLGAETAAVIQEAKRTAR
ncbi:MAG TPA: hypothetical protein VEY91_00220 [Candidatus Limnocylindria bacterium]|nr:hypothetical protein [Candidatus Limnocylindria bacterium]